MFKSILLIVVMISIIIGCENNNKIANKQASLDSQVESDKSKTQSSIKLDELLVKADQYVDQKIVTSGIVDHVCVHSGKKMILFDEDPNKGLHVIAKGDIKRFDAQSKGNLVQVEGILKERKIPKEKLLELQKRYKENEQAKNKQEGGSKKLHCEESKFDKILAEMEKKGKNYYSTYYMECTSYKIR